MSLIGGPEQSSIIWWNGVDGKSVYGYCENIGDSRGITVGLAGFTSYANGQEVKKLMDAYGTSMRSVGNPNDCKQGKGCSLCNWIRARGDDPKWIAVQWDLYNKQYIQPIMKYVPSKFNNALIKGLLIDTSMNAGLGDEGNAWGADTTAKRASGSSALDWVNNFCDLRYNHFTSGNPQSSRKGRLETWRKLARDGKWDLRGVDVCKYAFCYGKCKGC
jgi:chitosanase